MFYRSIFFASLFMYGIFMFSCNKEEFDTNPDIKLVFSTDTVSFDTVFTKNHNSGKTTNHIFSIDSLSPAHNIDDPETARLFPFDLNNKSKLEDEGPDLGALEWVPTEKN